jgi:hemolysin activation/secretion protein
VAIGGKATGFGGALLCGLAPAIALLPVGALAQEVPDAGQILREQASPRIEQPKTDELPLLAPAPQAMLREGGASFVLSQIALEGVTVFPEADLIRLVSGAYGSRLDYAGVRALSDRIVAYYRQHGYPFVSGYLPPQTVEGGVVRIHVLEGRYGAVEARGAESLRRGAQRYLERLHTGDLIESSKLERALLLLGEQPAIRVTPFIQRGAALGTGDLIVPVSRNQRFAASLGADTSGSGYTGRYRLNAGLQINSGLVFGDKLALNGVLSDQLLWLGSATYIVPIWHDGLKLQANYTHTAFELGGEFADLKVHGFARIVAADVEYPLIRSQRGNLRLQVGGQQKWLINQYDAIAFSDRQSSLSGHATLLADHHDKLLGGGLTYAAAAWWHGKLSVDPGQALIDALTAQRAGVFNKWTLDVVRLQTLPGSFSLSHHFSAQWSDRNLESSERLALGGEDAVRAYPKGEGIGDTGWVLQNELRIGRGWLKPYAFFDIGHSRANHRPWDEASASVRSISGAGLGARATIRRINLDAFLAWPVSGGQPIVAPEDFNPHWSVSISCAL